MKPYLIDKIHVKWWSDLIHVANERKLVYVDPSMPEVGLKAKRMRPGAEKRRSLSGRGRAGARERARLKRTLRLTNAHIYYVQTDEIIPLVLR